MVTEKDIENMYLVGNLDGLFVHTQVELFSTTMGGNPEVVFVYPGASPSIREAAQKYAEKHGLPVVTGKDLSEV